MTAVNTIKYSSPIQRRGQLYLRDRNLLASPQTLKNTDLVKRKARANKLKEEYKRKYLRKRPPAGVIQAPQSISIEDTLVIVPIIPPQYSESAIYTTTKRALTFCLKLFLFFLLVISICVLTGYSLRYLYR